MEIYENLSLENLSIVFEGVRYVEKWKNIHLGIKSHCRYQISSFGRIKRLGRIAKGLDKRVLPAVIIAPSKKKYLRFSRSNSSGTIRYSIHRLVAGAFVPNPDNKPQINHKDAKKWNNFFLNLEWCTQSENNKHAVEMNLCYQKGTAHVIFEDRQFIRENMNEYNREELAARFNITIKQVHSIGTNRDTKFLPTIHKPHKKPNRKAPISYKIVIDLNTGIFYTTDELAKLLGKKRKNLCRILNEETYPNKTSYRYA